MIVRRFGYAVAALALATVAACGSSHPKAAPAARATSSTVPSAGAPSASVPPMVHSIKLGTLNGHQVLVDANGRALYLFVKDTMNTSNCTGSCAVAWPPLPGPVTAGSGLKSTDLSTLTRNDNTKQVTYFGTPLYYYVGDTGPGTAKGQGLNANGGLWYLVDNKGQASK